MAPCRPNLAGLSERPRYASRKRVLHSVAVAGCNGCEDGREDIDRIAEREGNTAARVQRVLPRDAVMVVILLPRKRTARRRRDVNPCVTVAPGSNAHESDRLREKVPDLHLAFAVPRPRPDDALADAERVSSLHENAAIP